MPPPAYWADLTARGPAAEVGSYLNEHPLEPGMPVDALRHRLDLPDRAPGRGADPRAR